VEWGNKAPDVNGETFAIVQDGIGSKYPYFFDYSLDGGFEDQRLEIKYVHQLQNLFYVITGHELTI